MASEELVILLGILSDLICLSPVELAPVRLEGAPFHRVLGGDRTKIIAVPDDVLLGPIVAVRVRRTNEGPPSCNYGLVQTLILVLAGAVG